MVRYTSTRSANSASRRGPPAARKRLRLEPLEDRLLLATFTVTNLLDGPVAAAGQLPGSLRQAIFDANAADGPDIVALSGLSGTLSLTAGEMTITAGVTINGPSDGNLTIDARQLSRIFNITAFNDLVTISGVRLTGGKTTGDNAGLSDNTFSGGAIRSVSSLALDRSVVSGSSTTGYGASGGGIYARYLTLTNSTVTGNSTAGTYAGGGGISAVNVTLTSSIVSGNSTSGLYAEGGGIHVRGTVALLTNCTISENKTSGLRATGGGISSVHGSVTLASCIVSGNTTSGNAAHGGGVFSGDQVTVSRSTVSGNRTMGNDSFGGGVSGAGIALISSTISGNRTLGHQSPGGGINGATAVVTNSTISGNTTAGDLSHGGGIAADVVSLAHSTISGNAVTGTTASGGGVWWTGGPASITHSIIALNSTGFTHPDLRPGTGALAMRYNLIGNNADTSLMPAPVGSPDSNGNLIGTAEAPINPLLGPLGGNGGPTPTLPLLAGSPAIDAGDPAFNPADPDGNPLTNDALPYDQRGAPLARVFNGDGVPGARIDIGAFELQPVLPIAFGDYDQNGVVDSADYIVWRNTLGNVVPPSTAADGDGDGLIDQDDYNVWRNNFGQISVPPVGAAATGDYNQNAVVDAADYVVWRNTLNTTVASYSGADGNGNGTIDNGDYVVWRARFGQIVLATAVQTESPAALHGAVETSAAIADLATPALLSSPRRELFLSTSETARGIPDVQPAIKRAAQQANEPPESRDLLMALISSEFQGLGPRSAGLERPINVRDARNASDRHLACVDILFARIGEDEFE